MQENKLIYTTILKNHLQWCKENGRDTTWVKAIGNQSWYKKVQEKDAVTVVKKLSSWK